MARIIFIYGLVAGLIIIAGIIGTVALAGDQPHGNVWLGYLIMLLGMSAVFMGVKRYRDRERGGVIRFLPALTISDELIDEGLDILEASLEKLT